MYCIFTRIIFFLFPLLLLLAIIQSCSKSNFNLNLNLDEIDSEIEISAFKNIHLPLWSSTYNLELDQQQKQNLSKNDYSIFAAPGSWKTIAHLHILNHVINNTSNTSNNSNSCILYKLPHNKIYSADHKITTTSLRYFGELKVINNIKNLKSCDDFFFLKKEDKDFETTNVHHIHNIHKMYLNFDSAKSTLKLWGQVYDFKKSKLIDFLFEFPFYNLKQNENSQNEPKKFSSNIQKKIIPGLTIFPIH
ncbi:MAG: hypothetical protein HQK51_04105 [Oligoflexia bacterium]|nr:hypothetical protein [Oligoflexia bacterium]